MRFEPLTYFKEVAEKHVDILHSATNPAFFREFSSKKILFDNSDFLNSLRKVANVALVAEFNEDTNYNQGIDNNSRIYTGALFLIKKVTPTKYDDIENARKQLKIIWEDIYAKIKYDINKGTLVMRSPECQLLALGMVGDSYYGISILFSWQDVYCHSYNPAKWT